ncbi:MAG TPA: hypothetical protein PK344_14735 [Syntrophorhabdaceae bacterium]|jgi:hypothetical protein|nr:hypothetical protein [Candidatus Syntrophosphaera sp.]HOE18659.1 hypothetical protein [Syntrophorhabdaceae bacterium]HOY03411.1 hypothetical protein [Zoogloea sp.]
MISTITRSELQRVKSGFTSLAHTQTKKPAWIPPFCAFGLPEPEREYPFHPERKWRIDLCWPDVKLAVEIEGGAFLYGRHNRPASFIKDIEKYNALTLAGYRLLRFTPKQLANGEAQETILAWFRAHAASYCLS